LKGSYLLILRIDADLIDVPVGRLGRFSFPTGYYLYVGSAHGSGGLPARLAYHQQRIKAHPHWHVDYLRPHAQLIEIWSVGCDTHLECSWIRALAHIPELSFPIHKFGSQDNGCYSHLVYTVKKPNAHVLTTTLLTCLALDVIQQPDFTLDISVYEDDNLLREGPG
jgi:Uri superfamily endonuclease